ncbi:hypothetical protein [Acidipropionibacterium jensenii]|uniref:hypothetical protein n=1 Tax=Acidipropionibacterium jensenii TaxID=1749 RepID=UPI001586B4D9|nr:hypothetical protein [Acidipropionibacterium jensenii]
MVSGTDSTASGADPTASVATSAERTSTSAESASTSVALVDTSTPAGVDSSDTTNSAGSSPVVSRSGQTRSHNGPEVRA